MAYVGGLYLRVVHSPFVERPADGAGSTGVCCKGILPFFLNRLGLLLFLWCWHVGGCVCARLIARAAPLIKLVGINHSVPPTGLGIGNAASNFGYLKA